MDSNKRGAMLRREFERLLREAGATKSQRVNAASELPPEVIAKLLSPWRRLRVWRATR